MFRVFSPIQELSQLYTTFQSAMAGGERVLELLDTEPSVADPADGREMARIVGHVQLTDVEFAYKVNEPVLRGINLTIEPGQTLALVGPTGAGKSSIANLIARFYDVTEGSLTIDGVDVPRSHPSIATPANGTCAPRPISFLRHGPR